MSSPPPALAPQPQFTALYWDKAIRAKEKVKLVRMTNMDDGEFVEFVFDNGAAFQRRKADLDPDIDLHVNLVVYVETINNELVTGMWVPEQGWAFRMTSQDLADYSKKLISALHEQRQAARRSMVDQMARVLEIVLCQKGVNADSKDGNIALSYELAAAVATALELGPNSSANAR